MAAQRQCACIEARGQGPQGRRSTDPGPEPCGESGSAKGRDQRTAPVRRSGRLVRPSEEVTMATTIKRPPETPTAALESRRKVIIPFIERHAVATFYALAFAISFGAFLLVLGPDGFF